MGHLLDRNTVKKVELSLLEDNLRTEFDLSDDFKLINARNKEIDIV